MRLKCLTVHTKKIEVNAVHNELLNIGPFTVTGYGLMIAIGIMSCLIMADRRARKKGLDPDFIFYLGIFSIFIGFVSAKLLFVILAFDDIINSANPWQALSGTGFVVYGGIIGGVLAAMIGCRIKKVSFLPYFDLAAPSIAVAQAFGRIGCFLAGCCYGRETDSPLGIIFHSSDFAPNDVRLIPTQLISSLGNFAIMTILLIFAKKERKPGQVGGLYLIMYAVGRFIIEFFRNDYRGSFGVLSTSQLIAIIMLIPGIWLTVRPVSKKAVEKEPASQEDAQATEEEEETAGEQVSEEEMTEK
jgi:phosphatidylglycerol:prolipoprotein diacylglycerol transferase